MPQRTTATRRRPCSSRTTASGWVGAMLYLAGIGSGVSSRPKTSRSSSAGSVSTARPHMRDRLGRSRLGRNLLVAARADEVLELEAAQAEQRHLVTHRD